MASSVSRLRIYGNAGRGRPRQLSTPCTGRWRPLQRADRVLLNGAGYETWLSWISLSTEHLVDTSTSFQDRLIPLDQQQQLAFALLAQQPLLFSHPVYQYLERRYRLDGYSLHWEPDQEPGDKAWIDFGNALRDHPAEIMIWEDTPLPATAERLEAMGLTVVPYRVASNRPESGDYFDVMASNLSSVFAANDRLPAVSTH